MKPWKGENRNRWGAGSSLAKACGRARSVAAGLDGAVAGVAPLLRRPRARVDLWGEEELAERGGEPAAVLGFGLFGDGGRDASPCGAAEDRFGEECGGEEGGAAACVFVRGNGEAFGFRVLAACDADHFDEIVEEASSAVFVPGHPQPKCEASVAAIVEHVEDLVDQRFEVELGVVPGRHDARDLSPETPAAGTKKLFEKAIAAAEVVIDRGVRDAEATCEHLDAHCARAAFDQLLFRCLENAGFGLFRGEPLPSRLDLHYLE